MSSGVRRVRLGAAIVCRVGELLPARPAVSVGCALRIPSACWFEWPAFARAALACRSAASALPLLLGWSVCVPFVERVVYGLFLIRVRYDTIPDMTRSVMR